MSELAERDMHIDLLIKKANELTQMLKYVKHHIHNPQLKIDIDALLERYPNEQPEKVHPLEAGVNGKNE